MSYFVTSVHGTNFLITHEIQLTKYNNLLHGTQAIANTSVHGTYCLIVSQVYCRRQHEKHQTTVQVASYVPPAVKTKRASEHRLRQHEKHIQ